MTRQATAFVLMPFSDSFTTAYERIIRPALSNLGSNVKRADSLFNQQQILKDIVKGIADATVVVADGTGLNENVLYELGLAHALGKNGDDYSEFWMNFPLTFVPTEQMSIPSDLGCTRPSIRN